VWARVPWKSISAELWRNWRWLIARKSYAAPLLWQQLPLHIRAAVWQTRGSLRHIRLLRIFRRGLGKTEDDGIAEYEYSVNQQVHEPRTRRATPGTPPPKSRNGGRLPQQWSRHFERPPAPQLCAGRSIFSHPQAARASAPLGPAPMQPWFNWP